LSLRCISRLWILCFTHVARLSEKQRNQPVNVMHAMLTMWRL
jgi:hypothetical protein